MIKLVCETAHYAITLPESINEIPNEAFDKLTSNITLPRYYCIVALCFKAKLFDLAFTNNKTKNSTLPVTPIMCKISDADSSDRQIRVGDRVMIDRSSIERGIHLNIPTGASYSAIVDYFTRYPEYRNKFIKDKEFDAIRSKRVIVMEFKIIPVTDIVGAVKLDERIDDPYRVNNNPIKE